MNRGGRTTPASASGCGNWPSSADGSATAVCTSCWPGKASGSIIKSSIASIARNGSRCASEAGASGRSARVPRCCSPGTATSAGRSISSRMHWPTAGGFRILAVVDDFSRECLALVVDTSLSGVRVARELDRIVELRGRPRMLVSDNGTELTSNASLRWQQERGVGWHYIAPGKPMQKRLCRELQRPPARRVPQRTSLRRPGRSAADHRGMEVRLQHNTPAHEPGWAHTQRVCSPPQLGP